MSLSIFIIRLVYICVWICVCRFELTSKGVGLTTSCQFNVTQNDHNRQFDLSSLSKQRVWQAQINSSVYVFVAMCGHFNKTDADKCPDMQAAVCVARQVQGKWIPVIPNAGRTFLVNSSNEKNDFSINIVGGQLCTDSKNYTTTIFFTCNPAEALAYVSSTLDDCSLVLFWSTTAACVANANVVDRCTLPLRNGVDHFDIRPLHQPNNYVVRSADGRMFELNFCLAGSTGSCIGQDVAVCELTNSSHEVVGIFSNHVLDYAPESGLKLIYKTDHHVKPAKRTEVRLTCNHTATTVAPVFLGEDDHVYRFEVETWTACVQWPVECVTYDTEGNKYDLSALRKFVDNWEVSGKKLGERYIINVCASVNMDSSYMAKGVGALACPTNSTASCFILGTVSVGLVKANLSPLVLHYTGGSVCLNGQSRYKTEITFVCARLEKGPEFVKSEDCVYSFLWETPSACPIKHAVGKQCVVTEPTFNTHFDLRPLYNEQEDYFVHLENDRNFTLNVCGPLKEPCGGFTNASVCFKTGSKEIPIGWTSYEPQYTDGRVAFVLHGAECKPGYSSTVHIIFLCDHNPEAAPASVEYLSTDNQCTFFFVWHSHEACFPNKEVACKTTDSEGRIYDLSSLSLTSSNYVSLYRNTLGHMLKFTINVCQSVVMGYGTVCSYHSAVCMEDTSLPNSHNSLVSVGEVSDPPKFENGKLTLRYESGGICEEINGPPEISSSIEFICNRSALETAPVLENIENCHYNFSWRTNVACPLQELRNCGPNEHDCDCTAVNPVTNYRFDLSPLKNRSYMFKNQHGTVFNVSICGGLSLDVCGMDTGSCKIDGSNKISLGKSNSKLSYDTVLYLNYTDGDLCLNGKNRRNTWLQFVCGPENSAPGPSFVEDLNDCTTVVAWNTELACERKVDCEVIVGGRLVSLAPLISSSSNYKVPVQNYEFYINVCRPTVPLEGLSCLANSAACVAIRHANGSLTDELSLGVPYLSPLAINGQVILKYLKGSPCPNSPGLNISSVLNFVCDAHAGKGWPKFINFTDDCQYQFEWKTSIVCPPENKTDSLATNCTFRIEEKNVNISLQPFADHGAVVKADSGDIFHVNPCLLKSLCDGVGVCKQASGHNVSYGEIPNIVLNQSKELTKMRFSDGSVCSGGVNYSSEILLECDPHEQIGKPVVQSEEACSVVFSWKNSIVCFGDEAPDANLVESNPGKTAGVVITGVLLGLATLVAIWYFAKATNRLHLRSRVHSLFNRHRSHGCVQYSKLDTTEQASIMLRGPSSGGESGSDDDDDDDDELLGL